MKRTAGEKSFDVFNVLLLGILSFVALYPFIYTVSISLSTAAEAARDGFHLYPREISLTAYRMILNNREILVGYGNTILRTVVGTVLTLIFTCVCAYPLSRKDMPLRRLFMLMIILTMLFDGGLIPNYLLRKELGLLNNRLVYILPYMLVAFNIIVVKNFFQQVPEALAEAARIDGASEFRTLWQVYVPLSKPVLATVALWTAVMHWNMWFDAMVFVTDNDKQVMQTILQRIVIDSSTEMAERGLINPDVTQFTPETVKAATIIVTILPMLALYPFVQRYFVKGISLGGVKE
jgi:putative aldouronate transport system permease protein